MNVVADWPPLPLPELRVLGEALELRPWQAEDAAVLASAWVETEVARRLHPPSGGVEAARRWINGCADRLASGAAIDAAIVVDGAVVGEVGFSGLDRSRRAGLVGYWIGADHRGTGIASAALTVATDWWFATVRGEALIAQCAVDNIASWRTAESAGYSLLATRAGERLMVRRWSDDGPAA